MKKWLNYFMATTLVTLLLSSSISTNVYAESRQGTYEFKNINQSTLEVTLYHATATIDATGKAFVKDQATGKTEQLPTQTKDKNGKSVNLIYKKTNEGLEVQVQSTSDNTHSDSLSVSQNSIGQCILGTGGGAITGAGTLGLAGAAVGTVTIPGIGTVSAGLVGGIAGAVGGGMTGAAASCF